MSESLTPMPTASSLLPDLPDTDREQLQLVVSELFLRQAILRELPGDRDLYDWARQRFPWVREICGLIGFDVVLNEDDQLIYALPRDRSTLRKLKAEWTLVVLALWYDYDVQLRQEGTPESVTVEAFNESLKTKLGERQPSLSSLREILRFLAKRKLVRMEYADPFHRSKIEVLPTIRFVLPFGGIERVSVALEEMMAQPQGTAKEEEEDV